MPKLGEFIGALLADAAQARIRADLEAVKIAEMYSRHDLLKHLPVPRFRLPDITLDVPMLIADVELQPEGGNPRLFNEPTPAEVRDAVRNGLRESRIRLPRTEGAGVPAAAVERIKELFGRGAPLLLNPAAIAEDIAALVVEHTKTASAKELPGEQIQALSAATKTSISALLATKLLPPPSVQVLVNARDIKEHGDRESVVRMRLTISEDAYEVVIRADGEGYTLTPE